MVQFRAKRKSGEASGEVTRTRQSNLLLVAEAQLKKQQRGSQHEREQVGHDYGDILYEQPVDQPQRHPEAEEREHSQRQVFGRTRLPRFNYLWQEGNGGATSGCQS